LLVHQLTSVFIAALVPSILRVTSPDKVLRAALVRLCRPKPLAFAHVSPPFIADALALVVVRADHAMALVNVRRPDVVRLAALVPILGLLATFVTPVLNLPSAAKFINNQFMFA
jgi:hypothetical protein